MIASKTEDTFLREEIFSPVMGRVLKHADSLMYLARFKRSGIEGWLKVEAVRALGSRVLRLLNKGSDLELNGNLFVELKATINFELSWVIAGLRYRTKSEYYNLACLFLGSGHKISDCMERLERQSKVIDSKRFSVGEHEWIVGLVVAKLDD